MSQLNQHEEIHFNLWPRIYNEALSAQISESCKRQRISQMSLSLAIGKSVSYISGFKRGRQKTIPFPILKLIMRELGEDLSAYKSILTTPAPTILLPELAIARKMEKRRWPNGLSCPFCNSIERFRRRKETIQYVCVSCGQLFSVKTSTIMSKSSQSLRVWVELFRLTLAVPKLPVVQIAKRVKLNSHTARKMLIKINNAAASDLYLLMV